MNAPQYPGYGSACNGCGACCIDQPCPTARHFKLWRDNRCRALEHDANRYWCGLARRPSLYLGTKRADDAFNAERLKTSMLGIVGRCDARAI